MIPKQLRWMIYGACPTRWAARWGLEPLIVACSECGNPRETSIPFVAGELRGLAAPLCDCGSPDAPYCFVRDPEKGDLLEWRTNG